jgi:hypothetical protein
VAVVVIATVVSVTDSVVVPDVCEPAVDSTGDDGANAPPVTSTMMPMVVTTPPAGRLVNHAHLAAPRNTAATPITNRGEPTITRKPETPPDAAPLTSNSSHITPAPTRSNTILFGVVHPSSIHNSHPGGAGGQAGSGFQPGGGRHPSGGNGQLGGGLKRLVTQSPLLTNYGLGHQSIRTTRLSYVNNWKPL